MMLRAGLNGSGDCAGKGDETGDACLRSMPTWSAPAAKAIVREQPPLSPDGGTVVL